MSTATFSKKFAQKKVLIPAILGAGILLGTTFILATPLENSWAQQSQQQKETSETSNAFQYDDIPKINGSVNVRDGIKNFFAENTKVPFVTGAQTAQSQIANGTVLGGHIDVTQGYLTYTYFVVNPTNDTTHKVIIDAGNGQLLHTSEGKQIGSAGHSMFESFGQERGYAGFGGKGGFGTFGHGFGPFGSGIGFGSFGGFWHNK
jgi:uncharacterized membrane protein YkoI